jgi:hypothetical protein
MFSKRMRAYIHHNGMSKECQAVLILIDLWQTPSRWDRRDRARKKIAVMK